jgi:putative DNA primase/helicase
VNLGEEIFEEPTEDAGPVSRETDLGNARRLVAMHGAGLRYVPQWGTWLVWDERRWRRDVKGVVFERAKDVVEALWREVAAESDSDRRKQLARWAAQSEAANRIEAMVKLARTEPGIAVEPDELDADPWLFNVANATVDLRSGALRRHQPGDLITKIAPVVFDPAAKCPTWLAFLERIIPDEAVRGFLQEAVGYALTGVTSEQVLFFLFGFGANGKSTLTETVQTMAGEYGRQAEPGLLLARQDPHPTGVADLMGARLVVATEVEEGRRLAEATVKQLTGGDRIRARFMRMDFFEFTPTHKLFLHGNHRPVVRGTDHAIWRRLRLIPFTVTIPREEQDKNLPIRLREELPGILSWALEGCLRWQRSGLTTPPAVMVATDDYRAEMDVLGSYLEEQCVVFEEAYVPAAALYRSYVAWCDANGEHALSQRRLGPALVERGFERRKHGSERRWHWFGVGLLEPMNPLNPDLVSNGHTRAHEARTGGKGPMGSWVHLEPSAEVAE